MLCYGMVEAVESACKSLSVGGEDRRRMAGRKKEENKTVSKLLLNTKRVYIECIKNARLREAVVVLKQNALYEYLL